MVGADGSGEFVVFIGGSQGGRFVRHAVYFGIDGEAFFLCFGGAMLFVEVGNALKELLFLFPVQSADAAAAFKQHVLHVVRQAGGIGGVLFGTGAHGDVGEDARLEGIDAHKDAEAVGERVFQHLKRVAGNGAEGVQLSSNRHSWSSLYRVRLWAPNRFDE